MRSSESGTSRRDGFLGQTLSDVARERRQAEQVLGKTLEAIRATVREAMRPFLTDVTKQIESARMEGAKLGVSL